jgi:SAM-dependent methyltransferase
MKGGENIRLLDIQPCLHEKTKTTKFDVHYFYQDIWAFQRIYESKVTHHVDVGSRVDFVGFLSSITKVTFVDIRPIETSLKNLNSIKGDILSLPFKDNSIQSLSCLHVAEHIGLGRYGDSLDPLGTEKACKELSRVLAKGGNLYFSVPIGKPKVCFNAHRIHSSEQILKYFNRLKLVEFSGVDDEGLFRENINIDAFSNSEYACGLFWFKKL